MTRGRRLAGKQGMLAGKQGMLRAHLLASRTCSGHAQACLRHAHRQADMLRACLGHAQDMRVAAPRQAAWEHHMSTCWVAPEWSSSGS